MWSAAIMGSHIILADAGDNFWELRGKFVQGTYVVQPVAELSQIAQVPLV